jgi:hypothetical protein
VERSVSTVGVCMGGCFRDDVVWGCKDRSNRLFRATEVVEIKVTKFENRDRFWSKH